MTRTIWKFPIPKGRNVTVTMPAGATVLHVGMQDMRITMWALVNPEAPSTDRQFGVFGTGWEGVCGDYIGTVMDHGFVWHIFEVTP